MQDEQDINHLHGGQRSEETGNEPQRLRFYDQTGGPERNGDLEQRDG